MTRIYLVRHGETEWNKEKVFRGGIDIPLSERGRKEALALAEFLAKERIQFIYCSPLKRAKETSKPLAEKTGIKTEILEGLIDMNFGEWEGKSISDVEKDYPELFKLWVSQPEKVVFPKGETLSQVRDRAMSALKRVVKNHSEGTGVVISHRVICKLLLLSVLGAEISSFWRVQQDLACVNLLEWAQNHWVVHLVNETYHLKSISGRLRIDF